MADHFRQLLKATGKQRIPFVPIVTPGRSMQFVRKPMLLELRTEAANGTGEGLSFTQR